MKTHQILQRLREEFGSDILEIHPSGPLPYAWIQALALPRICKFLKGFPEAPFDFLRMICASDRGQELEVVYHLFSYKAREGITLLVRVDRNHPTLPSVEKIWAAANWHEREAFDLLGVFFEGHPGLNRILLPEDWVGHPLRKDYQEEKEIQGISTTREYPTDRLPKESSP